MLMIETFLSEHLDYLPMGPVTIALLVNALKCGSPALLMKLACLGRNDTMRNEIALVCDLRFGVL